MSSSIIKFTLLCISVLIFAFFVIKVRQSPRIQQVCFHNSTCYDVELAITPQEQETGLMHRTTLERNSGMLFIFNLEYRYGFWMKNTPIALDMIWIDKDKNVVFYKENAQPCQSETCDRFLPDKPAKYVLEVKSGEVKSKNLKIGDKVQFK